MASSGLAPFSPGLLLPLLLLLMPLGSGAAKKRLELLLETEDNAWMASCVSLASRLSLTAVVIYGLHILHSIFSQMLQGLSTRRREKASVSFRVTRGQCKSRNSVVSIQPPLCAQRWTDRLDRETQQDPSADCGPLEELAPEEPSAEEQEGPKPQEP